MHALLSLPSHLPPSPLLLQVPQVTQCKGLLSQTFPSLLGKLSHQVYADKFLYFKVLGDCLILDWAK